jgi:hypothetical protein
MALQVPISGPRTSPPLCLQSGAAVWAQWAARGAAQAPGLSVWEIRTSDGLWRWHAAHGKKPCPLLARCYPTRAAPHARVPRTAAAHPRVCPPAVLPPRPAGCSVPHWQWACASSWAAQPQ